LLASFLRQLAKFGQRACPWFPSKQHKSGSHLLHFQSETGTGKRQAVTTTAGNTHPSSGKGEPEVQPAASTLQRGSHPSPVTRAPEAVRVTLRCHQDPWHPSYPLVLKKIFASSNHFPCVPAQTYVQEPIFALFKAVLGKGAVRPNLQSLLHC